MRLPGKLTTTVLVAGLVLGSAPVGVAGATGRPPTAGGTVDARPAPGRAPNVGQAVAPTAVTLLTGDQVTVSRGGAVSVRPGPGREQLRFLVQRDRGRLSVLPLDAAPLVRSGRVDARLFDVTELVDSGYDDARRADLPLLVTFRDGAPERVVRAAGVTTVRQLPAIGGVAVRAAKAGAGAVWSALTVRRDGVRVDPAAGVDRIWLDGRRRVALDRRVPQTGAPVAHRAGWTGKGVTVAVLDTGVDATHPDLAGRLAASVNFSAAPDASDQVGHGTQVASTIAGGGAASGGEHPGVAPGATLVSGKVCEDQGCAESAILAGMQWAAAEQKASVVNLSLGGAARPGADPLAEAVDTLTAQTGALFVIDAGNAGAAGTVGSPSMATPEVAGAAALLAQQHPGFKAGQLRAILTASAAPHPEPTAYQQGAGRVDVARAVAQPVTSDPVSVSFGRVLWPHHDDTPITRTITYRHAGAAALTLELAVEVTGPDGKPAPAGMFRLDTDRLTVPAGGQAQVTVTADTRVTAPDGTFTGRIVARAAGVEAGTPVTLDREVESYSIVIEHLGRDGAPATDYYTAILGLDVSFYQRPYDPSGTVEVRAPKGRYGLSSSIFVRDANWNPTDMRMLNQPELVIDGETDRITVDARRARPLRMTVPATPTPALVDVSATFVTASWTSGIGFLVRSFDGVFAGQIAAAERSDSFVFTIGSQWVDPESTTSPYLYALLESFPGRTPNGFVRHYRDRDLATVTHVFHGGDPRLHSQRMVMPEPVGWNIGGTALVLPTPLPGRRVERYNTNGVRQSAELVSGQPDEYGRLTPQAVLVSPSARHQPGRSVTQVWNAAPLGPSFPARGGAAEGLTRQGDTIGVSVPLHSDAAGHPGASLSDSARTALYRDGTLVGELPEAGHGTFDVPPTVADYRLETVSRRDFSDLSTEVGASWTFRSGPVAGDGFVKLPAMVVRFAPRLDARNTAPAGRRFTIPVTVQRQPGAPASKLRTLTVQVSYDGGKTWQEAVVRATGSGWEATVRHPAGSGHASLRATATDRAGNTVTQHIVNAYRLG